MDFSVCQQALLLLFVLTSLASGASDSPLSEYQVKRQELFEFSVKPSLVREGDRVTIQFESKGYCDATVAVENAQGRIVRHLACGVLGNKAPEPFAKGSLKQVLVWDGKDDQGKYIDDKETHAVRVALGLKPEFEKSLYWSPYKRISENYPMIQACPEGVVVYDGKGTDHIRLFDHDGRYLRTIYPFPADKLSSVNGLNWFDLPAGGRAPMKLGPYVTTYFSSGDNATAKAPEYGLSGRAASTLSLRQGKLYLSSLKLNRLALDGSSGGMELEGPKTTFPYKHLGIGPYHGTSYEAVPTSSALSPDGQWLYLTGYLFRLAGFWDGLHGVARINLTKGTPPEVFAGSMKQGEAGSGETQLHCPTSVACDAKGQVYVSDYMNNRIQVFNPDGKLVRSIPAMGPARVVVPEGRDELYVFSWPMWIRASIGRFAALSVDARRKFLHENSVTRMGPLSNPRAQATYALPLSAYDSFVGGVFEQKTSCPIPCWAEVDPYTEPPTIWLGPEKLWAQGWTKSNGEFLGQVGHDAPAAAGSWEEDNILVLVPKGEKLEVKRNFGPEAKKMISRSEPPMHSRQRMHVNPLTGKLYLMECEFFGVATHSLLQIDPETDRQAEVNLPFTAEDLCFDLNGNIYLRSAGEVGRYDFASWREVPFDYGEERAKVCFASGGGKAAPLISALIMPFFGIYRQYGMTITPTGHLMAAGTYIDEGKRVTRNDPKMAFTRHDYTHQIYPGRFLHSMPKAPIVHIWDNRGKLLYTDALPGLPYANGIALDKDDNLYVMMNGARILDGKRFGNPRSDTLFKAHAGKAKVLATIGAVQPLTEDLKPKRPFDLKSNMLGPAWIEGAEWMYGGVGMASQGSGLDDVPSHCACSNARFALDYFGRSFAPELDPCSVAVLDTNGNLILHVGKYGNVDSAGAKSLVPLGGDNTGLVYPVFLATHTDRRLFIADPGNANIASVALHYHTSEILPIKADGRSGLDKR